MFSALVLLACAILNRLRGGGFGMERLRGKLPGRPLWYVSPAIAGVAYLAGSSPLIGAAYLLWGIGPWGRWFDLGRLPDGYAREGVKPSAFERVIGKISGGSDHLAMLARHAVAVPALAYLVGWPALLFPLLTVAAYELAWQLKDRRVYSDPIHAAELLTGLVWGAAILL